MRSSISRRFGFSISTSSMVKGWCGAWKTAAFMSSLHRVLRRTLTAGGGKGKAAAGLPLAGHIAPPRARIGAIRDRRKTWPRGCCSRRSISPTRTPTSSTTAARPGAHSGAPARPRLPQRRALDQRGEPQRRRRHLRPRHARCAAERTLQGDRLRELICLDQARHGHGAPHHALHRRPDRAGRPRRAGRRRRAAGRLDECRSGRRAGVQRVVQRRAPGAVGRGAGRAVRPPLLLERAGSRAQGPALYHLANLDVPRSEAWKRAADTPWTARMRPHFRDMLVLRSKRYVRQ